MRLGPAALLTPAQAEEQLPGPVFYLLAGFARPVFPQSTPCAPSPFVLIEKHQEAPGSLMIAPRFPVSVNADQWREAVVPVLEDPRFQVTTPIVQAALIVGGERGLLREIGAALRQSFVDAGYGPT